MTAKSIKDINNKYSYKDENPGGEQDANLVSCAQCDGYNELQYIFDKKLKPFIDKKEITEANAIAALEKACTELKNPRKRVDFYKHLSKTLGVAIK